MKGFQFKKPFIIVIILGVVGLGLFYIINNYRINYYSKKLSGISDLSKEEAKFLFKNGLIDFNLPNLPNLPNDFLKPLYLIEQNLSGVDENFKVLATRFEPNKKSYKMAFKLENKSQKEKEFYLVPVYKKHQAEFLEIKGVIKGEKRRRDPFSVKGRERVSDSSSWPYDIDQHKNDLIPSLAQAYDDIIYDNYDAKPIRLAMQPNSTLIGISSWKVSRDRVSGSLNPIYLLVYGSAGGAKEELKILNVHSYPQKGDNWEIEFETKGRADLKIIPADKTTIEDDEFKTLYCGQEEKTPQILLGDIIYYPDWECNEIAKVIHYTKKAGEHTLRFEFGNQVAYAYNSPDWLSDWFYRKQITIDNSQMSNNGIISASYSNFPLYVDITSDSDIGEHSRKDGYDIRFTDSDGTTELDYEREYFDIRANGMAMGHYWVEVPSLNSDADTSSNDTIYIYYGKADASDGEDAENVWDANYVAVHHLVDYTTQSVSDSTSNSNDGYKGADGDPTETTEKIYKGQNFDGNDYMAHNETASLDVDNFTISAWVKVSSFDGTATTFIDKRDSGGSAYTVNYQFVAVASQSNKVRCLYSNGVDTAYDAYTNAGLSTGTWYYLTGRYNGAKVSIWLDGVKQSDEHSTTTTPYTGGTNKFEMGRPTGTDNYYYTGELDEVRVSNTGRLDDWIKWEYFNMNESDNELSWGSESILTGEQQTIHTDVSGAEIKGVEIK